MKDNSDKLKWVWLQFDERNTSQLEDSQTLEYVAQGGCEIFHPGGG